MPATYRTDHEPTSAPATGLGAPGGIEATSLPTVKLRMTRPHKLTQATQASWSNSDPYLQSSRYAPKPLDIRASKGVRKRALAVMDRFIKALEGHDLQVETAEDHRGTGTFAVDGRDRTQIYVYEEKRRVEHVPTAKELHEKERYPRTRIPKWDDVPTGDLVLVPGGPVDLSSDQAITQLINKAVADVIESLADVRQEREADEAARREEWERRRAIEEEKSRVEAMHKAAASLQQYRLLTDYIEEVRRFGRVPDDQLRDGQTLEEWLAWAEWQAQKIHPLGD